jgi:hypothetical protein
MAISIPIDVTQVNHNCLAYTQTRLGYADMAQSVTLLETGVARRHPILQPMSNTHVQSPKPELQCQRSEHFALQSCPAGLGTLFSLPTANYESSRSNNNQVKHSA